jgi:hypothetical protein
MFGVLRYRGFAAVFSAFAIFFATPSTALAAEATPAVVLPPVSPVPAPVPVQPRPLGDLVISWVNFGNQTAEELCLAKTVYFEARGESLEGQLAVAEVVLNRKASAEYPDTICDVVTQPAQFSFIRNGKFPRVDVDGDCWHKALAIADIARKRLVAEIGPDVLWYHASYVSPDWGHRLTKVAQIGTHIFYS